jgi:hypothetical protein
MLKNVADVEGSIKCRRKAAGWNEKTLERILFGRELGQN